MSFTHCHECNRGGCGNAADKCSCGWKVNKPSDLGCYIGTPIDGAPRRPKKATQSQERYQRYLDYSDSFDSFRDFLSWDCAPGRSWNR